MQNALKRYNHLFNIEKRISSAVIINSGSQDPNFYYFTGFRSGLFESSILIVRKNSASLLTYELEYQDAVKQKFRGLEVINIAANPEAAKKVLDKAIKGKSIGMNGSFLPFGYYDSIEKRHKPKKIIDISESLTKARMIKDDEEIASIRKAAAITKKAMVLIQKHFKVGTTEKEIARRFNQISADLGSEMPSFDTIVCFGKNASLPHHSPDNTKLQKGDIVLIDAGAKYNKYCSDITRSFIFGKKSMEDYKKKKEMYDAVKEAHDRAINAIKIGASFSSIHGIAADYINSKDNCIYKGKFIHALGHSLGIEVHDGPGFSPGYTKIKAEENMVITVEPGIYIKGFGGIRIEDDVLITKKGAVIL